MGYTIGLLLIGYWAGSRGFVLRSPFARKDDLHED
jgi:hypothetical protein